MKYHNARNVCPAVLMSVLMVFTVGCSTQQTVSAPANPMQPAAAAMPKPAQPSAVIEPKAMAALQKMGGFLRSLKAYQVSFKVSKDEVLDSGQKIMVDGISKLTVQTPDHLHFSMKIDEAHRDLQFFYDGKTFTLYGNTHKFYASVPAPATIHELMDIAEQRYNINMPFRDLFIWGTDKADAAAIRSAIHIGSTNIDGIPCDHYAFRNVGVDWQLWIQQGDTPLPLKLVITTLDEEQHPQYVSVMDWNLAPKINRQAFTFVPAKDAHKIEFAVVDAATENLK